MTTQMGKLKKSYSERIGVSVTSLRFLFDGKRINDDETPKQVSTVLKFLNNCYKLYFFLSGYFFGSYIYIY